MPTHGVPLSVDQKQMEMLGDKIDCLQVSMQRGLSPVPWPH